MVAEMADLTEGTKGDTTRRFDVAVERALAAAPAARGRSVCDWTWIEVEHRVENMTTERFDRCRVRFDDGGPGVSFFVKTLRPASLWPGFSQIPAEFHENVLRNLDWRNEERIYRSSVADALPHPLRLPGLFHVEREAERMTLWLEDVPDVGEWNLARYRTMAEALGRMSAAFDRPVLESAGWPERRIRDMFFGKICNNDLPLLAADAFWDDDVVRAATDESFRSDLEALAESMPARLDRLDALPQVACHGDATPDNFRMPGDGSIVAIDWSYATWAAPGSDLGQLLVGRVESGAATADEAPVILETIVDGYLAGARSRGADWDRALVEEAFATTLAVRSLFSALVVDHRPDLDDEARAELTIRRGRLARVGLDLCRRTA